MKTDGRRSPLGAWAMFAAGLALTVGGLAWRSRARPAVNDVDLLAQEARFRIESTLESQARALEATASEAARLPEVTAALGMGVDRATLQDLLENEDWWLPYRSRFPLNAVIGSDAIGVIGHVAGKLADSEVVRAAREHGVASGLLPGSDRAFLVAAASTNITARPDAAPVILVGQLVDAAVLKKVRDATGDMIGLSDGTRLIETAGRGEPARALAMLVGKENAGPVALPDGRTGAAWSIGGGMWILEAFEGPVHARPGSNRGLWLALAGSIAATIGLVAATFRRARQAEDLPITRQSDPGTLSLMQRGLPATDLGGTDRIPTLPAIPTTPGSFSNMLNPNLALDERMSTIPIPLAAQSSGPINANPTRMGRYELIERIGEGGMAEIFFAAARGAEDFVRYFVVKRLHPHLARQREAVNQFTDEARLQAGLVHSNIVPVFDFGKADGEYFIALEYIHGRDLGQVVQRHVEVFGKPLDFELAFFVMRDVLEALSFAHSQTSKDGTALDIVHRDVSPANVLVSYRGEIRLTDFGIALSDKRVSRTEMGIVKGNASFMSPEQARGEAVDQRSDVFSAGLVLFYCLTGELLYRGDTAFNVMMRASAGPEASQLDHIDQLPVPAARVLRRALAADADVRYANAREFASALEENMSGRPELALMMDVLFPTSFRRDLR